MYFFPADLCVAAGGNSGTVQKGKSGTQESVCHVSGSQGVRAEAEDFTSGPCGPSTGLSDRARLAGICGQKVGGR